MDVLIELLIRGLIHLFENRGEKPRAPGRPVESMPLPLPDASRAIPPGTRRSAPPPVMTSRVRAAARTGRVVRAGFGPPPLLRRRVQAVAPVAAPAAPLPEQLSELEPLTAHSTEHAGSPAARSIWSARLTPQLIRSQLLRTEIFKPPVSLRN